MILRAVRLIFILMVAAVALAFLSKTVSAEHNWNYFVMVGGVVIAFVIIVFDMLAKRKNLAALSGVFFGIFLGMMVALALGYLVNQTASILLSRAEYQKSKALITGIKLLIGLISCYLGVSFIVQTRDDFRFIIPYVEFSRVTRGARPLILDTSVIIDGRIADMAQTGIFESRIIIPRFVLNELQAIADSGDRLKRGRGRRGLDILHRLQGMPALEVHIWDGTLKEGEADPVDQQLLSLAAQENGRIVTNDYNLNKVAQLRNVSVVNINDIANSLKPVALPGETMTVKLLRAGESAMQAVGYLEDGTMVVVENGRGRIGEQVELTVTSALQTSAGRMIFGRMEGAASSGPGPGPGPSRAAHARESEAAVGEADGRRQ